MQFIVNGESKSFDAVSTVEELLLQYKLDSSLIIVELNKKVILRENYLTTKLKNNDSLELIRFMGGG